MSNRRDLLKNFFAEAELWEFDQAVTDVASYADLDQINYMEDIDNYSPSELFSLDCSRFDINDDYFIKSDKAVVSYCLWIDAASDCLDDLIDWLAVYGAEYDGESESLINLLRSKDYLDADDGVVRKYCANCQNYKCRCKNCAELIFRDDEWYCNDFDNYCEDIDCCMNWEEIETDCSDWKRYDGNRTLTVNIGFINSDGKADETQFCIENLDELGELFYDFCDENDFGRPELLYIYSLEHYFEK